MAVLVEQSAAWATPMNVEIESKRSVKRMPIIAGSSDNFRAPKMSNLRNTVLKSGGVKICSGAVISPAAHAIDRHDEDAGKKRERAATNISNTVTSSPTMPNSVCGRAFRV